MQSENVCLCIPISVPDTTLLPSRTLKRRRIASKPAVPRVTLYLAHLQVVTKQTLRLSKFSWFLFVLHHEEKGSPSRVWEARASWLQRGGRQDGSQAPPAPGLLGQGQGGTACLLESAALSKPQLHGKKNHNLFFSLGVGGEKVKANALPTWCASCSSRELAG